MSNMAPKIELLTEKAKIAVNTDQTIDVLVRVTAPERDAASGERPVLNFGIALDRSGSMGGQKMLEAREAAKYCVDQLLPTDRFSAVIFDDHVDVLFTNQHVRDREMLKRGLSRIDARGSTALHDGWLNAGYQVSERLDDKAINRILLITDGQANVGETRVDRIVEQARQLAARGVSTSTIGIGQDFYEDLLMPMAEAGQGNAWHVREPEDMVKIFETEMHGLINQFANSVTLKVTTSTGVKIEDALNDLPLDSQGRQIVPNLMAASTMDIVLRLRISAGAAVSGVELASFELEYTDQASGSRQAWKTSLVKDVDSVENVAALPIDASVTEAVQLLMAARARKEVIEKMDRGDYQAAGASFDMALADIQFAYEARRTPAMKAELDDLQEMRSMFDQRENDAMTRKRMAYSREARRKGRM